MDGKIKWFSVDKGYGFITSDCGDDHYFHVSNVIGVDLPGIGDRVRFVSLQGPKGLKAKSVEIVEKHQAQKSQSGAYKPYRDDRVVCPGCGRRIVPRMVIINGSADHSICPFCATWVEDFNWLRNTIQKIWQFVLAEPLKALGIVILLLILSAL